MQNSLVSEATGTDRTTATKLSLIHKHSLRVSTIDVSCLREGTYRFTARYVVVLVKRGFHPKGHIPRRQYRHRH